MNFQQTISLTRRIIGLNLNSVLETIKPQSAVDGTRTQLHNAYTIRTKRLRHSILIMSLNLVWYRTEPGNVNLACLVRIIESFSLIFFFSHKY